MTATVAENHRLWEADYLYDSQTNEFRHRAEDDTIDCRVRDWFNGMPEPGLTVKMRSNVGPPPFRQAQGPERVEGLVGGPFPQ
jgi:hypothetical protein